MYVTNVVNNCMALNNNYDATIIQFNLFFVLPALSLYSFA